MTTVKHLFFIFISAIVVTSLVVTLPVSEAAAKNKPRLHKKPGYRKARKNLSGHGVQIRSRDPYLGAIVIDADTRAVLFDDNADVKGYPASMVKLMDLLIIIEAVKAKHITLKDRVTISSESAKMGGSQVYLAENEVYSVDDLLYALMVQSANDAATALALHYSGSKEAFVQEMNRKAQELGMKDTVFHSVHGLPPGRGQRPDISTPRDIIKLCLEVLKHPEALIYTSTKVRAFRVHVPEPFIMRNHNHLVGNFDGCDGLKTGYFRAAGFSIAATAVKKGKRAIAVIFGAEYSRVRDAKARALLTRGLRKLTSSLPDASASIVPVQPWHEEGLIFY